MVFLYYVEIVCLRMPKKDNTYARERSCSARQNSVDYGRKKRKEKKKACTKTHSKDIKRLQNVEVRHYTEEKEEKTTETKQL